MGVLAEYRQETGAMPAVNVAWAVAVRPSLRRRARTAGVPLTPDALAAPPDPPTPRATASVGWP
ncbi:hypothetical protein ACRAWF_46130 [Streptomyces sp. L7]